MKVTHPNSTSRLGLGWARAAAAKVIPTVCHSDAVDEELDEEGDRCRTTPRGGGGPNKAVGTIHMGASCISSR
jgi:hypothetical protein